MPTPDFPATATVSRTFPVPPERVYDAFVNPAIAGRWLFATPSGTVVRAEFDPRPGGKFVVVDRRGEMDVSHEGEYLELDRPRRIRFQYDAGDGPSQVEAIIEPDGTGARLTITHFMAPEWADFTEQAKGGWTMMLGTLSQLLK